MSLSAGLSEESVPFKNSEDGSIMVRFDRDEDNTLQHNLPKLKSKVEEAVEVGCNLKCDHTLYVQKIVRLEVLVR